jgi:hypothetical protein
MTRLRLSLSIVVAALVTFVMSACTADGPMVDASSQAATKGGEGAIHGQAEICTAGFTGFKTQFLPMVQNEVCNTCHNGDNPNAPPWLVGDDEQMYLSVKNYVNFGDLTSSRLFIRAGNRHCGGGCNAAMADRMKGYLQSWFNAGESTCDQSVSLRTEPQPIPADLPSDHYVTMGWELSSIDVGLRGARIEVEIRRFTAAEGPTPGSYFIRKPRFVSTEPFNLTVQKMRILNNRAFQEAANEFERVNAVVGPDQTGGALSYPVLSPEPLILVEDHPGADQLMVSFEKLVATDRRMCRAMDKFRDKVKPVVEARSCTSCHVPGATSDAVATTRFDMSGTDEEMCAKFLSRTWSNTDVFPALIQYPLFGRFEHPRVLVGSNNILPDWTDWITAEWQ